MADREQPIRTPEQAWPRADRLTTMKSFVRIMAEENLLHRVCPGQVASTYRLCVGEVEAEIVKNSREEEGGGK